MIDIIGYIPNGNTETEIAVSFLPGWHINSSAELVDLNDYLVFPTSPYRLLAGVKTFCYRLESEEHAKLLLNWTEENGYQPVFKTIKSIPMSVTRRQARQQFFVMGLLDEVIPAINSIEDVTERNMAKIYWEDTTEFERNNPYLLRIALALKLDSISLDDAFIRAATL